MTALLAGHAAVGVVVLLAARKLRTWAFLVGAAPLVATLVYAAWRAPDVLDGRVVTERTTWVPALDLSVTLRLDGFGLLMTLVVAGIGVLVMAYGASYFPDTDRSARNAGLLTLFAGSMLGVVLADNVGFLYVAWELTSVTSFFLIGMDHERPDARSAALHALLVTAAGGLALLGGLVLLAQQAGTWSLSGILAAAPTGTVAGAGLALVVVGIVTKSAQFPFHTWLPGAMVAATPVSAYLHSATMVKAGIYLAARLAPVFAATAGWRPALLTVGLVTMVVGGVRALRQDDLKLLLAMGTISQLGFLLVLFGAGYPEATVAGCVLLVAHALFKATLFLVVGLVDHQAGTRDRLELGGLGRDWLAVRVVTVVAAASMVGLPPVLGFVAKEAAYEAFAHHGGWGAIVLVGLVGGSMLTVAYTVRFAAPILTGPTRGAPPVEAPSALFAVAPFVLGALTLLGGLAVGPLVGPFVEAAASDLDAANEGVDLALWHGFGVPLLLSAVTLVGGAVLVVGGSYVDRGLAASTPRWGGGVRAYGASIRGLNGLARRVAGVTQSGSLPVYVAIILTTAVVLPATTLVSGAEWPGWPVFARTPAQVLLAAFVAAAAIAAAMATRRFAAVVLLGAAGYGMGLIFVVQGAPDLALTQFAIETLTVVAFVLVLRYLPRRFERRSQAIGQPLRLALSGAVAVAVFGFAVLAGSARRLEPIGEDMIARALPEAGGRNVVNVVLVDFRGLDTLGEISVLAVAAVGVVALSRVGRRSPGRSDRP